MLTITKNNKFAGTLENFLNDPFFDSFSIKNQNFSKNTNIIERDDEYEVKLYYAGLKKDDFIISFEDNILDLKAEGKDYQEDQDNDNYLLKTHYFRKIHERYKIQKSIDHENIIASYEDGVLKIILPKNKDDDKNNYKIIIK